MKSDQLLSVAVVLTILRPITTDMVFSVSPCMNLSLLSDELDSFAESVEQSCHCYNSL